MFVLPQSFPYPSPHPVVVPYVHSFPSPSIHIPTANSLTFPQITVSIGDEIRSSSSLAESMNDSFDNTRVRLRGTMNRMLRMAKKTGVGWKVWLGFFVAVWLVFAYVWLF